MRKGIAIALIFFVVGVAFGDGAESNGNSSLLIVDGNSSLISDGNSSLVMNGNLSINGSLNFTAKELTPKGRIFDHSLADFKNLRPLCPCTLDSPKSSNRSKTCALDICYCQLECPVPENSFSPPTIPPRPLSCAEKKKAYGSDSNLGYSQSTRHYSCFDDSPKSRLSKMLCVYYTNTGPSLMYWRMNLGWTPMKKDAPYSEDDGEVMLETIQGQKRHWTVKKWKWNWERSARSFNTKISTYAEKCMKLRKASNDSSCGLETGENITETSEVSENKTNFNSSQDQDLLPPGLNFTKSTDPEDAQSLIEVFTQPTFTFKAQPPCTELTSGNGLAECLYYINTSSSLLTNCDQVMSAVKMTSEVVAFLLTNRTDNVTFLRIGDKRLQKRLQKRRKKQRRIPRSADSKDCMGIPTRGIITEVLARKELIGIFVNFNKFTPRGGVLGTLKLSFTRVYISDQQLHNLPRFWDEFFYGECSGECLRDFGKVGPQEVWRLSTMDDTLIRYLGLFIMFLGPFVIWAYLGEFK